MNRLVTPGINDLDIPESCRIASASSARPGRLNWTVLALYDVSGHALPCRQYVAEIIGETLKEGEVRRVRRASFSNLATALNWNAFDHRSALFDELRTSAIEAMERKAGTDDFVRPPFLGTAGYGRPPVQRSGFDGAGGLQGALEWLYLSASDGITRVYDQPLTTLFAQDFGISADALFDQLEIDERGEHPEPHLSPAQPHAVEWRNAFIAALAFFDRDAFQAQRVTR